MNTRISVIIPAYNEANYIGKTLDSVISAKEFFEKSSINEKVEIIVVDNSSNDGTDLICNEYKVNTIREPKRQIAACRNQGAKNGNGEVFIFLDADTIVPQNFLQIIDNNIKSNKIIGGSARLIPTDRHPILLIIYWLWNQFSYIIPFKGAVLYCEKNTFLNLNGFDENLYALEDVKFSLKLKTYGKRNNKKFLANPKLKVHTSTRKLKSIGRLDLLKMIFNILLNPFSFYRKKEIVNSWFYTIR